MTFQSIDFIVLLAAVFIGYWAIQRFGFRWQNLLLLGASYVFYAYVHQWLAFLLLSYTLVTFAGALAIERRPEYRKWALAGVIVFALGTLGFFKYFNFFAENFAQAAELVGIRNAEWSLSIFLPIGISFYTFQLLAYAIDVYKKRQPAATNIIDFGLFASFFPQLVAGPIERARDLLPQIQSKRTADPDRMREGLVLLAWGFFKKLVIADNVASIANQMFALEDPSFGLAWVGVLAFGIQILADFSAYTDIARGTAMLLGFRLSRNFLHPYLSVSPADFWRRWHVTLSYWFRDYVYIPLGGNRMGQRRKVVNLLITFLVTGLWHGAAWNFVAWGLYHGVLVSIGSMFKRAEGESLGYSVLKRTGMIIGTFLLVNAGWLLFREGSFARIIDVLTLSPFAMAAEDVRLSVYLLGQVIFFSLPLWLHPLYDWAVRRDWVLWLRSERAKVAVEAVAAGVFCLGAIGFQAPDPTQFIYFQF